MASRMEETMFKPQHDWSHAAPPHKVDENGQRLEHYAKGCHVLSACKCGIRSIGFSDRNDGKLTAILTDPPEANREFCPLNTTRSWR